MRIKLLALSPLLLWACSTPPSGPARQEPAAQDTVVAQTAALKTAPRSRSPQQEADLVYGSRCAVCHGIDGQGDGPENIELFGKPGRSLRGASAQAALSDAIIERAIIGGDDAPGPVHKKMKNEAFAKDPALVAALVARVRQFGRR